MGGFLDEADDDEWNAFEDAQLRSDFQVQEEIIQREPVELPEIPRLSQTELPDLTPKASEPYLDPTPVANTTIVPFIPSRGPFRSIQIKTCSGKTHYVPLKKATTRVSYERLVAGRSVTAPGRAQKSYYGIDIHTLLDEAAKETETETPTRPPPVQPSIEAPVDDRKARLAAAMWTEKYRARKFTELIGDERTHRSVLRWLKAWEPIVFPNLARSKPKRPVNGKEDEERTHRKVLLLCGPPGLGKTTLAHVCARQAGYEVLEINASDDRSKDVVKGRIRDALATENVKGMNVEVGEEKVRKAGRPVCVVVDEVDGVTTGSGGSGEGGFMKALIDLVLLDQKNSTASSEQNKGKKKKGDNFRFLRPLIMVCNDVYHPSLRPLRAASVAEIIHVRQAPLENVVSRMKRIFTVEGIPSDNDGVRRLCEASWGLARRKQGGVKSSGTAEGDIRSVLVAAEWVAHKLRNECPSTLRLTRSWLEQKVLSANTGGSSFFKGLNRGGVRDLVERVFTEGAGFADAPVSVGSFRDPFANSDDKVPVGVADLRKRHAIDRLREMVDASGEHDRCVAECFSSYPLQTFQDDTFLSKPNAAYEWLHFHDTMSSKVYTAQDWELSAYLSQSVVAFHHLFASAQGKAKAQEVDDEEEEHPFSGPRADFAAYEAQKQNRAILTEFQSAFTAPLSRLFRSTDSLVIDLIPNLIRMLSPDVKPVVVRGSGEQRSVASVRKESERALVQSAVRVMAGLGVRFDKVRIENAGAHNGWAYRMEPPLDTLITFSKTKANANSTAPVRYAVRQVLDQEYRKENIRKHSEPLHSSKTSSKTSAQKTADGQTDAFKKTPRDGPNVKRDFFGRIIKEPTPQPDEHGESPETAAQNESLKAGRRVWVTYHDGFSNAVRKPISLGELLAEL
ncbi:sister chromatid cohesion factor [Aspergillus sclerotiicarbonarius CBS 121057]|uniref:Sister chromatid cohesion factor n=1 Tax=Aspergillus sclerotiicarbonarius (strain CBS 121057 / IBT 28362) TaxID=1448318 RepID=A0A319DYT5_ASPSB|nr:sister chromatid cohesion factor [Aspergillus sclerotiicarbonarius CBS 121057]